jgi:aminoglycoside phosphotransferase (APT) family kinase protein
METEVFALNKMHRIEGFPVPKVLYYDKSRNIIDNQFFFMEFVEGTSLDKISEELSEKEYNSISSELGNITNKINSIESDYFGYISQENKRFSSWAEAFLNMIKELLNDASEIGIFLPIKDDKLYNLISSQKYLLNKVKTSVLVHKDLWAGNIFVDPKSAEITGIVDWERALFGDGLLDIVCGFLLDNKNFIQSYLGRDSLTEDEEIRCILYKIYLYLIMIIESDYRKYQEQKITNWARSELDKTVNDLKMKT